MLLDLQRAFGMRVRDLRKEQGFSQEGFADHCGVHRTYMGNVERGVINISFQNIAKLAIGLKLPMASLMAGVEQRAGLPPLRQEERPAPPAARVPEREPDDEEIRIPLYEDRPAVREKDEDLLLLLSDEDKGRP